MIRMLLVGVAALALLSGCGGDSDGQNDPIEPAVQPSNPVPPSLGVQVDRMGRAAIATALVVPFAGDEARGAALDAYNTAEQQQWSTFSEPVTASLAVYDGLDGLCGNQILADLGGTGPERYATLAGALADDRLYLDASAGACSQYLAVELDATGLAGNEDCGGRTPLHDTIDVSYAALANDLTIAIGDGVPRDDRGASIDIFPFLKATRPPPSPPALGAQVDRMGRSAIATALVSPIADDASRGLALDAYNRAAEHEWGSFAANLRTHLAVYDALDGVCGNQFLAARGIAAERYDGLTAALVDDRLYVNTAAGNCSQYLAVELDATGVAVNDDCGGRTPRYDTIDISYTVLSNDLSVAVSDGVDQDDVLTFNSNFPFLAEPAAQP
ncbi:MAG: hypothetical protein VX766_00640 [Pseudomonadota bacterium]|nr:hypothetical protein [Pseudomonadota bacterium]